MGSCVAACFVCVKVGAPFALWLFLVMLFTPVLCCVCCYVSGPQLCSQRPTDWCPWAVSLALCSGASDRSLFCPRCHGALLCFVVAVPLLTHVFDAFLDVHYELAHFNVGLASGAFHAVIVLPNLVYCKCWEQDLGGQSHCIFAQKELLCVFQMNEAPSAGTDWEYC